MSIEAIGFSRSTKLAEMIEIDQEPLLGTSDVASKNTNEFVVDTLTIGVSIVFGFVAHAITSSSTELLDSMLFHFGAHILPFSVFFYVNCRRTLYTFFQCQTYRNDSDQAQKSQLCHQIISTATRQFYSTILHMTFIFFVLLFMQKWNLNTCAWWHKKNLFFDCV